MSGLIVKNNSNTYFLLGKMHMKSINCRLRLDKVKQVIDVISNATNDVINGNECSLDSAAGTGRADAVLWADTLH